MEVNISSDELRLLIRSHLSMAENSEDEEDARYHEARAAVLMEEGGYSEPPA